MKKIIYLLILIFTFSLNSNLHAQKGKKHKMHKKHKVKKKTHHKIYRITSQNYSNSRVIYTGPRGGRYNINSNGNKTYVK